MRRGIHRRINDVEGARQAWVSEAPGEAGEWLAESEYRMKGYSPDFDNLPSLVVQRVQPVSHSEDEYFFDTPEQASNFARMMGDGPCTTTSFQATQQELLAGQRISPEGEGPGCFFPSQDIPSGPVTIHDSSVLP